MVGIRRSIRKHELHGTKQNVRSKQLQTDRFSHSTYEQQQSKLQLLIHQLNMNSSSIPTPETPFQNNNDGCVQTSVGSDLTKISLDCKPSAAEKGIAHDFDSYSLKDIVFNESENAIVAIGEDKNITNPKLDRFMIISNILSSNLNVLGLVIKLEV